MITLSEALNVTLGNAVRTEKEIVDFTGSVGRVLAADIMSDINMPPFDKSAMDGYACRKCDLGLELEIIEEIPAGFTPSRRIGPGQCSRIMTGAMLPEGADIVVEVENTEQTEVSKIRVTGSKVSTNICFLGEDVRKGDLVLKEGTLLGVRHVPVLASVGAVRVPVYKQPKVAVLATGTELVEPDQVPGKSQIRNSNAAQTAAQLKSIGINADYRGIAPDDEKQTYRMFEDAMKENDILILSGGVSMGKFDFVPSVLKNMGFNLLFDRIAVQPGKPTTFGAAGGKYVFGLPGNPVSSFVIFELLVKPFIYFCMGHNWEPALIPLKAGQTIKRGKTGRQSWFPVSINEMRRVVPLEYHGSAHIFSLIKADGISSMEIGQDVIREGDWVNVRQI